MFCCNCGKEIDDNAVVCIHCGVATQNMAVVSQAQIQPKKVNGFGIAGFVIGLLSLWFGAFFAIPSIMGLVFSILGVHNMKKCNSVNGLAVAGLILSIMSLCLWGFFWLLFIISSF